MAGAKVPLTFRLYKGDQFLREEKLTLPVIKVGKLSSSHLRLDDDSVSRMHAVIEVTGPGDVSIIDLGSTKGTFVNGQKVNKAKLQSGDSVVVGDTRIEVTIGGADDEEDMPTRVQASPAQPGRLRRHRVDPAPAGQPAAGRAAAGRAAMAPPPVDAAAGRAALGADHGAGAPRRWPAAAPPPGLRPPPGMPAPYGSAQPIAPALGMAADAVDDIGGARAVEIAAMLGDSVVQVKHCMNPRGGKVTATTYGLFAPGRGDADHGRDLVHGRGRERQLQPRQVRGLGQRAQEAGLRVPPAHAEPGLRLDGVRRPGPGPGRRHLGPGPLPQREAVAVLPHRAGPRRRVHDRDLADDDVQPGRAARRRLRLQLRPRAWTAR